MMTNANFEEELLSRASAGDLQALGDLLQHYREKLLRIIHFRMDPRLRSRLDADDILQDAYIESNSRFADYVANQEMPFFLWLRFIAIQKLFQLHRKHLGAQIRDAAREVSIYSSPQPQATSAVLAAHLLGKHTSPSVAAVRAETTALVENALNSMNEMDREILALRRFEKLSNSEVSELLDITKTAASNRYIRALQRLKTEVDGTQLEG